MEYQIVTTKNVPARCNTRVQDLNALPPNECQEYRPGSNFSTHERAVRSPRYKRQCRFLESVFLSKDIPNYGDTATTVTMKSPNNESMPVTPRQTQPIYDAILAYQRKHTPPENIVPSVVSYQRKKQQHVLKADNDTKIDTSISSQPLALQTHKSRAE